MYTEYTDSDQDKILLTDLLCDLPIKIGQDLSRSLYVFALKQIHETVFCWYHLPFLPPTLLAWALFCCFIVFEPLSFLIF